jgi:hydrogenase/urease accessory protein HupE
MRSFRLPLLLLWLLAATAAWAHETRPASLQLTETQPGRFEVLWKVPARGELVLALQVQWPAVCRDAVPATQRMLADAVIEERLLECDAAGLVGERLVIAGLSATLTDVLARLEFLDGRVQTNLLKPSSPWLVVEGQRPALATARTYLALGIEHILLGIDHLLFVLGLLLMVPHRGLLLKTITAFTVAHSLTLASATLGYACAPVPPLNAAIALSILFLGPEIVRFQRGETSLTLRHPWVVAFVFGLLHGFSFASGLSTLGLPHQEIPLALLLFNVGVEIGQVGFVALVLLLQWAFRTLELQWPRWAQAVPAYAIGALGASWTLQRTIMVFGGLP